MRHYVQLHFCFFSLTDNENKESLKSCNRVSGVTVVGFQSFFYSSLLFSWAKQVEWFEIDNQTCIPSEFGSFMGLRECNGCWMISQTSCLILLRECVQFLFVMMLAYNAFSFLFVRECLINNLGLFIHWRSLTAHSFWRR